jgi:hypothetical protein
MEWYTVDGGGGESAGSGYALRGTVGQPDCGESSQGDVAMAGGFWPFISSAPIFADGFEWGDTRSWSFAAGPAKAARWRDSVPTPHTMQVTAELLETTAAGFPAAVGSRAEHAVRPKGDGS